MVVASKISREDSNTLLSRRFWNAGDAVEDCFWALARQSLGRKIVFGVRSVELKVMVALAAAENVRVLAVDPSEEACKKAAGRD